VTESLRPSRDHEGLWVTYKIGILICMRTTLHVDDDLLRRARRLTGVEEKTALVRLGLEALIALESARRLARLGGSEKKLKPIVRRRTRGA
jgi:Arc/MetJ family transcription regulator